MACAARRPAQGHSVVASPLSARRLNVMAADLVAVPSSVIKVTAHSSHLVRVATNRRIVGVRARRVIVVRETVRAG